MTASEKAVKLKLQKIVCLLPEAGDMLQCSERQYPRSSGRIDRLLVWSDKACSKVLKRQVTLL